MAGYIEDRWLTKRKDPETGQRRRTALYGSKTKRYRVAGIPGVRKRSFDTAEDAKKWKSKAEHETRSGEFIDPRLGELPLADYIDNHWWPSRSGDPATLHTIRGRLGHIVAPLGHQPLNAIKVPQLRLFLTELETKLGPTTIHEVWGYLSAILQCAVDDERIRKNYCKTKSIKLPTLPERKVQPWPKERVRAVRAALPERFRVMVDAGVGVGLRQGEVFGLAADDINTAAQLIHVRRQVKKVGAKQVFAPPKGGRSRTVPAPAHLLKQLEAHMEAFPPKKIALPWRNPDAPQTDKEAKERAPQTVELIFTSVTGLAIRRDGWNLRCWKPALAAAGVIPEPERVQQGKDRRQVKKYVEAREDGFHVLRHTFASVQLHARETIVSVSKWLGHKDPTITLRVYAHMLPEADGRGRQAMDAWFEDL